MSTSAAPLTSAQGSSCSSEWVDPDDSPATDELLTLAMNGLAAHPRAIFLGQGVAYGGVATSRHLGSVLRDQLQEFPVAEELQLGVSIGLALQGYLPISVFPRVNFLWRAADQLINHLDCLGQLSGGQFQPKVIIRTRVGPTEPLNAGPQHTGDYTDIFRQLLKTVEVWRIKHKHDILSTYQHALKTPHSIMVLEDLG